MKTTRRINRSEIGPWVTPVANQGQIVEVSYATGGEVALRREFDGSAQSECITAYEYSSRHPFEPWNETPILGRRLGNVEIVEDESA